MKARAGERFRPAPDPGGDPVPDSTVSVASVTELVEEGFVEDER